MMELVLRTGSAGDRNTIFVDWFDENCVPQQTKLDIVIQNQDKPRTLEIRLNGVTVAVVPPEVKG